MKTEQNSKPSWLKCLHILNSGKSIIHCKFFFLKLAPTQPKMHKKLYTTHKTDNPAISIKERTISES